MAWTFLVESEESQKPYRPGLDRLPIVKTTDMLKLSCFHGWPTGDCRRLQFGMMCVRSRGKCSMCRLTLFTEGSHARTCRLRESELAWMESGAAFSSRLCGWPGKRGHRSFSLRMSPVSGQRGSDELGENWPPYGMIVDGVLYPLMMWERRIVGKGGSFWPTIRATDADRGGRGDLIQAIRGNKNNHFRMWPTPKGHPSGPDFARVKRPASEGDDLATAVSRGMWPTPRASEWKGVGPLGSKSQAYRLEKKYLDATVQERTGQSGSLNPTWVEWLMGYPLGWTALKDWATQWFRSKRGKRSKG